EWIMERYKVTKDKDSGIVNDPNHWSEDPRYIVDLVKRIVRVSMYANSDHILIVITSHEVHNTHNKVHICVL
ncbi:MAG: type ISP restriction/modification enzyme, partial [Dolichospermum sp.]